MTDDTLNKVVMTKTAYWILVIITFLIGFTTGFLMSSSAHAQEAADVKFNLCLRQQAAVGGYFGGSYNPQDVGSLVRLVKQCPLRFLDFSKACRNAGTAEGDCNLRAMMMALDAAEEFKR